MLPVRFLLNWAQSVLAYRLPPMGIFLAANCAQPAALVSPMATTLKDEGNRLFSDGDMAGAVGKYQEAVAAGPDHCVSAVGGSGS